MTETHIDVLYCGSGNCKFRNEAGDIFAIPREKAKYLMSTMFNQSIVSPVLIAEGER